MLKIFFAGSILILLTFASPQTLLADVQKSQRWVCLAAARCDLDNSGCTNKDSHRVKLSVKADTKPFANSETFVIECLATPNGQICTTGNAASDQTVYGTNNVSKLSSSVGYRFEGLFKSDGTTSNPNPSFSNSNGVVGPFEWASFTTDSVPRKFLALNFFTPSGGKSGTDGGQQQGALDFSSSSKSCVSINWDPYGRVFDSQSLEPIPDATVTLFDDKGNIVGGDDFIGSITNPQVSADNGGFSFVVPDGTYKISASKAGYTFPNVLSKLNSAYSKAYSDIYRGEEIVQQGSIVHRDIPLDSATSGGKTYPLVFDYFYESRKFGKITIEGRSSHPLSSIKAYSVRLDGSLSTGEPKRTRYKLLKTGIADKDGRFKMDIDQAGFETGEVFGELEVQKAELAQNSITVGWLFSKLQVNAAETTTLKFDPIPNYLEGYAYGSAGEVMPGTTVGVYLTFSEKPYYETQADDKGFFKISSEFLPNLPYRLKYGPSAGSKIEVSTSKVIAQNVEFIEQNDIKVNLYKDSTGKLQSEAGASAVITSQPLQKPDNKPVGNSGGTTAGNISSSNSQSMMLLVTLLILVLLGLSLLLLGFYFYHKNKAVAPPTSPTM